MTSASATTRKFPILAGYSLAVFAFIYLPIVVLVVYSFNRDGVGGFPPGHLTLDWYRQLFSDGAIWNAVLKASWSLPAASCFPSPSDCLLLLRWTAPASLAKLYSAAWFFSPSYSPVSSPASPC